MLFNSLEFIIFFPIAFVVALILPRRGPFRHIWLLVCSYYFYMCWDPRFIVLIMFTTAVTFLSGKLMGHAQKEAKAAVKGEAPAGGTVNKTGPAIEEGATAVDTAAADAAVLPQARRRFWVAFAFVCNLSVLFYFKYAGFFLENVGRLLSVVSPDFTLPSPDITLPVGISFFTFQALSYTMDVYRGDIEPESSLFRYALYVAFFPQLVAGPIERSERLLSQLRNPISFSLEKAGIGVLYMIWGYFQKVVVADRIAIVVDTVYGDIDTYKGAYLAVATVLFAFQIYCDFGGYSLIARGAALFFGIDLMENFDAPYLSRSVAEFWRRWHISLSSWLRDYLYIPLGGSRRGKARKYLNIMIVFLCSGLWHGARWSFVVWGGLNGLYQIVGEQFKRLTKDIRLPAIPAAVLSTLVTFILVDISWIFFRAEGMGQAVRVIKNMLTVNNMGILTDGSLYACGLERPDFILMLIAAAILILADILKYNGLSAVKTLQAANPVVRGVAVAICIWAILLFGVWGSAYNASSFIYFAF